MNRHVLGVFLRKELRDLRSNPQVWPGYLLLPIIGIVLPIVFLVLLPTTPLGRLDPDLEGLLRLAQRDPMLAAFPEGERLARLLVRESGSFFLLMPVILSGMSAALAIAAEKQQRTLEPILATPIAIHDLLAAKLLASLGPALLVTWGATLVAMTAAAITTWVRWGHAFWPDWPALLVFGLLAPACGAVAALLGMRASIRARDVHAAVQSSGLWVVPAGIFLAATLGRPALRSAWAGVVGTVLVALLGWWLFRGNVRRFEREEVLTRWA